MHNKLLVLASLICAAAPHVFAYDFSAQNAEGKTIYYNKTSETSVAVTYKEDPTKYGSNTFYSGMIIIPDEVTTDGATFTVTAIEEKAFFRNTSLLSVEIPASVSAIGNLAFAHCSALTSVTLPEALTTLGSDLFVSCVKITSMTLPANLTYIPDGLFSNCTALAQISIPPAVTSIGNRAFQNCTVLASVNISGPVTTIGENAFSYCKNLKDFQIPNSVTEIKGYAFNGCSSLTSLTLPASLRYLGVYSLDTGSQSKLKSLTVLVKDPNDIEMGLNKAGQGVFGSITSSCRLAVPAGCAEAYAVADQWKKFSEIEAMLEPVETPQISIDGNRLIVTCPTEGAQIHTSITTDDHKDITHASEEPIDLTGQYLVTSYATAEGMAPSETANAILLWVKSAETTTEIDSIEIGTERTLLIRTAGDNIEIHGTAAYEKILITNLYGQTLYSGTTSESFTTIVAPLSHGGIYIIQIGSQSFKYKF